MKRAYKFLLRPTGQQTGVLASCLEDHRQLYNAALEHRRTAWQMRGVTVRYGDQSAELKDIRRDDQAGQGRWSFSSQQATLRRLDKAAESAGRTLIAVNPANTSRTCPNRGHCAAGNRVTQAVFRCLACGFAGHADMVGATNVLRAGLALQATHAA